MPETAFYRRKLTLHKYTAKTQISQRKNTNILFTLILLVRLFKGISQIDAELKEIKDEHEIGIRNEQERNVIHNWQNGQQHQSKTFKNDARQVESKQQDTQKVRGTITFQFSDINWYSILSKAVDEKGQEMDESQEQLQSKTARQCSGFKASMTQLEFRSRCSSEDQQQQSKHNYIPNTQIRAKHNVE